MARERGGPEAFNRWVGKMSGKKVPGWTEAIAQKVYIQAGDGLILGTPVGDARYWTVPPPKGYTGGRARGSWQATLDRPASGDINRIDKSGRAPKDEGSAVVAQFRLGKSAFWTSNVPYILRLAHGWSRQAPDGWVPRTLRQISNQFK